TASYLFYMGRSFKRTYKPSGREFILDQNPYVYEAFENSFWACSLEGLANLSFLTGDSGTDNFFQTQFPQHVETTYAYLYLIALHQRYGLLYLSTKASRLPRSISGTGLKG